jgi:4-hydroxyphenylpyruvate dioxygenase-like putative hemolysin
MADAVKLEAFDHVGLVVKSRAATIKSWGEKMGVGPWRLTEANQGPVALAHARVAGTLFELIEPADGKKSLWHDFLNSRGEGLHHIATRVSDVDGTAAKMVAQGGKILTSIPGGWMAYVEIGGPGSVINELLSTKIPVRD